MGTFMQELVKLTHPHYVGNFFLSVIFFLLKTLTPFCYTLFDDCELELREWELLTFLGCIIVLKNRKQPSYKVYIGTVCMFAKILSMFLFFRQSPLYAFIYALVCFVHIAFLPEPSYAGPDNVTYFRSNVKEELESDKRITWIVEFYAAWQPTCVNFANDFAELSGQYALDNLKFGKVDVTRFPKIAEEFNVNASAWSKQLPTVIMFQGGKEFRRRPAIDANGKPLHKFVFNKENIVKDFELNETHNQCKKNPIKKKKSDLNKDKSE